MTAMQRTLVIMAKAPRNGEVKTRLAASLPMPAVTELYRCLLNDTIALAQSLDQVDIAIMCPASDLQEMSLAAASPVRVVPQAGSGLAAALDSVFVKFAAAGSGVIAFNSDSPHLPASALRSAFEALQTCDLVVGPTHDGGYYLVGARASHPGLFANHGMGTTTALDALLQRAAALHLSVRMIDPFYDIDVDADLTRLADELHRNPEKAPRTAAWLAARARAVTERRSSIAVP